MAASAVAAAARYPRRRWWDNELHQLQRQNVAAAATGVIYGGGAQGVRMPTIFGVGVPCPSSLSVFPNLVFLRILRNSSSILADATFRPKRKCSKQFQSEQPCLTCTNFDTALFQPSPIDWADTRRRGNRKRRRKMVVPTFWRKATPIKARTTAAVVLQSFSLRLSACVPAGSVKCPSIFSFHPVFYHYTVEQSRAWQVVVGLQI